MIQQETASATSGLGAMPQERATDGGWFFRMCEEQTALACAFSPVGECLFINRAMRQYSGLSLPMRHGQGFRDMVHPDDLSKLEARWREAFRHVAPFRADVRLRDVAGRYRWFDMNSTALLDGDEVVLWYTTAFDIHDRRVQTDELQAVLDAFPGLVALWDADWHNRYANAAHVEIMGFDPEAMRGMHVRDVVARQGFDDVDDVVTAGSAGQSRHFERTVATPTGQMRHTRMSITPVRRDGELDGILTVAHDITDIVTATAELERANTELRRSNEDLERFAYVASHDLQEPLRTIASYTRLLAERYRGALDERGVRYIDYAVDAAQRMQQLIVGLLEVARLGRAARTKSPVDLFEVVSSVRSLLAKSIAAASAEVRVGPLPVVLGHREQLVRLFQNLLSNALKFVSKGRPPVIEVGASSAPDGHTIWVADNGEGIAPSYRERVFGMFQRLHTREEVPGNGIGLAIVKRVVELHAGRVWIESSESGGAKMMVWLPSAS